MSIENPRGATMGSRLPQDESEMQTAAALEGRVLLQWLESRHENDQKSLTEKRLADFLERASQPRHASGDACVKLCFFLELCEASKMESIRKVAFSRETCLSLFNFYLEWNEKNQNRSMRQVLELVCSLISQNPDEEASRYIKDSILQRNVSIIGHRAAQPLVKPAFKSLECLVAKRTVSTEHLLAVYHSQSLTHEVGHAPMEPTTTNNNLGVWDSLISEAFEWMPLKDISPAAGKFLVTIFRELRIETTSSSPKGDTSQWQRWIREGLTKYPDALESVKNFLLPPLFKLDRSGSLDFLNELNSHKRPSNLKDMEVDAQALLQFAAMDVGKKLGLVDDPNTIPLQHAPKKKLPAITLDENTISPLLTHTSDTVRSLAFSVLVSSSSSIRPFTASSLDIFQSSLGALFSDTDAKFRNEVLSSTKHLIERLRGSLALLTRQCQSIERVLNGSEHNPTDDVVKLLEMHQSFLVWFLKFLLRELIPTSSYQRHITALRSLHLLLRSGMLEQNVLSSVVKVVHEDSAWQHSTEFFNEETLRLLLDLLLDPFEDVRSMADSILKLAPPKAFTTSTSTKIDTSLTTQHQSADNFALIHTQQNTGSLAALKIFLARAEDASKLTGRADYADGVARCHELIYILTPSIDTKLLLFEQLVEDLVSKVMLAEQNLGNAVLTAPLHGTFAALNSIWGSVSHSLGRSDTEATGTQAIGEIWDRLQVRMFNCCSRIWAVVRDVLCNDSPEGHFPQELEEGESLDTKDLLSYSFRAIHESSNLMRTMAGKVKDNWEEGAPVLPAEVFTNIGDLTFEQLSNLRHRGSFATVSLTFARFCQLTQHQEKSETNLLDDYYQGALKCILAQASTTRRSAGIPALLTGILSAHAPTPNFTDVLIKLKSLARLPIQQKEEDETNLPQVHAMNCIKEIFKHTTLGKRSEAHISDCLQIAVSSLNSDVWAIRNCGLLLLRSLIDCLFGTSESKVVMEAGWDGRSIKLSYDNYPSFPELLLSLLSPTSNEDTSLGTSSNTVESVLPALDILRRAGPPNVYQAEIYSQVSMHLGSKLWHVREIAARTICTLLLYGDWAGKINLLLGTCNDSANCLHGTLLAIRFFLERRVSLEPPLATDDLLLLDKHLQIAKTSRSHIHMNTYTLAAEMELNNMIAYIILLSTKDDHQSLLDFTRREFPSVSYTSLNSLLEKSSSKAPLHIALIHRAIYAAVLHRRLDVLKHIVQATCDLNTDLILCALELIARVTIHINPAMSPDTSSAVSAAYVAAIMSSSSAEIHISALTNIADLLDHHMEVHFEVHDGIVLSLQEFDEVLREGEKSPGKSNVVIRISGWVQLSRINSQDSSLLTLKGHMEAWGYMLSLSGDAVKDFETRYAAVTALRSFYVALAPRTSLMEEHFLPSLLALYDTLNDDDDEVRDLAASAVSSILKTSLIPLAAQQNFLRWLQENYGQYPSFVWNVVLRMVGGSRIDATTQKRGLVSAELQLQSALRVESALFVEEEQNLFIDEVREARLWNDVFQNLPLGVFDFDKQDGGPLHSLGQWVVEGLQALSRIKKRDGPLGWTSKPTAFVACTRILISTKSFIVVAQEILKESTDHQSPVWLGEIVRKIGKEMQQLLERSSSEFHPSLLSEINTLDLSSLLLE